AARRLRLSTLGFIQFLAPSVQFLLAVSVFQEPFLPAQRISFGFIWAALAVFTVDALLAHRQRKTGFARLPAADVSSPRQAAGQRTDLGHLAGGRHIVCCRGDSY